MTVTASFEGGRIGRVEQVAPDSLRCAVRGQADRGRIGDRGRVSAEQAALVLPAPSEDLVGIHSVRPRNPRH